MRKFYFIMMLALFSLVVFSCHKEKKPQEQIQKTIPQKDTAEVEIFYLVPSPDDIFGFASSPDLYFDPSLPNPVANAGKYNNTRLQDLNFGVYSADLAYSAAFGKREETKMYLDVVKSLSEKIGLSEVFNESLVNRINNIGSNKDSLIAISNDTYFDIIRYLEKYDRISTLAILAAGGWLETMYLVVNLTHYTPSNPTIQKIADQKIIFSNLYKFLQQNITDPNVKYVYDEYSKLNEIFNDFELVKTGNQQDKSKVKGKIIVGSNVKIVMNKQQFIKLRNVINDIRADFTLNK